MKTISKNKVRWVALATALALLLAGCQGDGSTSSPSSVNSGTSQIQTDQAQRGDYGIWDEATATKISFSGSAITVDGNGASVDGGVVTISAAGDYLLSGTLDDGQVYVKADKNDTVKLILNGVDITSSTSAGIYSAQSDNLVIILPEGTENSVADAAEYAYASSTEDEPDAAVFAKNNLTITGNGALKVTGNFNNGIGCKDDLIIESGSLSVTAANHGIRGRDSVTVLDGYFSILSGSDGIQSNNDTDADKGWINLSGGVYSITSANDGIQAETSLTVSGGEYNIASGGGNAVTPTDTTGSYKGIKAGGDLTVIGGSLAIDSADDTVHSNGNVTISGGTLNLASGDDGVHADAALTITGGTIDISTSYEGLEGTSVDIADGTVHLVAGDDGINAAGGNDATAADGRFGRDQFASDSNHFINIRGGWIVVNASGDGIDSNGNVTMSGGTLVVNGPTNSGNGALDYDGQFDISGGVLVTAGSSGMAQAPSSTSAQASLQVYFTSAQAAGTALHIAAADGTPVLTFAPEKNYQYLLISTPNLTDGSAYSIYSGGDSSNGVNGLTLGDGYTPGTLLTEVTLAGSITSISDTGEAVTGGMGGMGGGFGGGGRQPGVMGEGTPPDGFGRTRPGEAATGQSQPASSS